MTEEVISFFDCAPISREDQFSVISVAVEGTILTVKETAQSVYVFMEKAARSFSRWITVTAETFRRAAVSRVRAFVRIVRRMTGVQILRQSSILRF